MKSLSISRLEPYMAQHLAKDTVKMLERFQYRDNAGIRKGCWQVAFCFLTNVELMDSINEDYKQLLPVTRSLLGPRVHEFNSRLVANHVAAWLQDSGLMEEYGFKTFPYSDFLELPEIKDKTSCIE